MFTNKSILLKVCGMRDPKNILEVCALQPAYMGFIFYERSPRYVGENFNIPMSLPASIKRVGVFVNEKTEVIKAICIKHNLNYVQLHGNETTTDCAELKASGINVIKAFSIDTHFKFATLIPFENYVDYFLFDTKGKFYGGNSIPFDWRLLKLYNQAVPFFLSGGLSSENISEIKNLQQMNLYAIDLNSGVEVSPAAKSVDKIKKVQNILKSLDV